MLAKQLKERLPTSEVGEDLFEFLVLQMEKARDTLCKEGGDKERGEVSALKKLLELFEKK